jgi:hypothetical protein
LKWGFHSFFSLEEGGIMVEAEPSQDAATQSQFVIDALYALLDARAYAELSKKQLLLYLIDIAILEAQRISTDGHEPM